MGEINRVVRRGNSSGEEDRKQALPIRLSGTNPSEEYSRDKSPEDGPAGPAIGREGNDYKTPDADSFLIQDVNGDRLQDFANTHLNEGPKPGRIPRRWTDLVFGKRDGREITGQPDGRNAVGVYKANQGGGAEDQRYIPHLGIPRGSVIARAYQRTVDDAAPIPAVYVGDPSRR